MKKYLRICELIVYKMQVVGLEGLYVRFHLGQNEIFSIRRLVNLLQLLTLDTTNWNSLRVLLYCGHFDKWNFILGYKITCKHYSKMKSYERKYHRMQLLKKFVNQIFVMRFKLQSEVPCAKKAKYMYISVFNWRLQQNGIHTSMQIRLKRVSFGQKRVYLIRNSRRWT